MHRRQQNVPRRVELVPVPLPRKVRYAQPQRLDVEAVAVERAPQPRVLAAQQSNFRFQVGQSLVVLVAAGPLRR